MVPSSDWSQGAPFAARRKCILVVEDELMIRLMVSEELRETGHDVIEAFNADEALAILNSGVRVDLLFSDVRMPGSINGLGLLALVRANFPSMPVILASADPEANAAEAGGASHFLAKPYLLETVVSLVRDSLEQADGR